MALSPGGMLSHYRLVEKIGEGGENRRLGRQYINGAFSARGPGLLPVCQ